MDAVATTQGRELAFAGVAGQARMIRAREVSPRELVEATLERIDRLDGELNAFRVVFAERALVEADQAAARAGAGDTRPLLGVPVAVKDDQAVAGTPRVWGTSAHGGPEPEDSELVRRLRSAGAIVVGVTRTPELSIWAFTETASGGITRNPWDPQRTPGGSSGGSGSAVAAGLVPAGVGSDGLGSIRIPAACCGLFGLKIQRGRLPFARRPQAAYGLAVDGFLTRSVGDSALLYEAVTGQSWTSAAGRAPGRLRVALSLKTPPGVIAPLDAQWRQAAGDTADLLAGLGHDVVRRDPDYGLGMLRNTLVRFLAGVHTAAGSLPHPERLERRTRGVAQLGALLRPLLPRACAAEGADAARVNAIFDDVDVVLGPTLSGPPLPVGRYEGRGALWTLCGAARFVPFTGAWNHVGNPAAAVPAGMDSRGLPLSVQLAGPPGSEGALLALARQLEEARPWSDRRPPIS